MPYLFLSCVLALLVLAYRRARLWLITLVLLLLGTAATVSLGPSPALLLGFWLPVFPALLILNTRPLRRKVVSAPIGAWFRKVLPPLSLTEREALEAGTVWWDGELFSGKPDWRRLLEHPAPRLSREERAFLDGPVEELCRMLDDWEITGVREDLPPEAWEFIRTSGLLGMIIPKAHGGLEFSAQGNSAVVMKIASRSQTAAVTVMVPNSLGPGELLMHFGTREQKDYYLPRLADGREIPCFALTGPYAGSDAASMPDRGVVCKGTHEGEEVLGLRVSWEKRYITLAPVATVLGLAFRAEDPEGLLGKRRELGITCALVPVSTPGVKIGDRHMPSGSPFMNGPTEGEDVFIPLDWVIGGRDRVGQGWRMLMHCLSAGRAISLPALATACSKQGLATSSAYARVRKQFKTPIARFEGVAEVLARMAASVYRMDAARELTLGAIDAGEKPAVLSAILKYQLTEEYRNNILAAMDIHGGKGIVMGPSNYLGPVYQAVPMAITVEGANILTRSLIIFGQGAIRCHPFLLSEMRAAAAADAEAGLRDFDIALFGHVGYSVSNAVRAFFMGVTGTRLVRSPVPGELAQEGRLLKRFSAAFSITADLLLMLAGGKFKFMERMSGRFADVLIHLYLASAVIKRFRDQGSPAEDLPVARLALNDSFRIIQEQLFAIYDNFPVPPTGALLRRLVFPWGRPVRPLGDRVIREVAALVTRQSDCRSRLITGIHLDSGLEDPASRVEAAFEKALAAEQGEAALRNALGEDVTPGNVEHLVRRGLETGIITEEQAEAIRSAQEAAAEVVAVDQFTADHRKSGPPSGSSS